MPDILSFYFHFFHFIELEGAAVEGKAEDGQTPLHAAALWGHTECVQLLLSHGEQEFCLNSTQPQGACKLTNWVVVVVKGPTQMR